MYIKRIIEQTIIETSKSFPCIVLYGPRQVGKSTTINYLFENKYKSVTLDNEEDRLLANQNPRLFLENYGYPLIIDEIQKVPKLLNEIKVIIDNKRLEWLKNNKKRKLLFILTGSNRFELQESIADSLAGRCGIIDMNSLTSSEKYRYNNKPFSPKLEYFYNLEKSNIKYRTRKEIYQDIFIGGMPDIYLKNSERIAYFKSYINTYIEKDILKLISVSSEMQFRQFLTILAFRTGQELHYDDIANNVGIDARTCKKWISILQMSGLIYLLYPYMNNATNRVIKSPKIYFMDTGLCAYLCRWESSEVLLNCSMSGAFFETYVVSEIIKNLYSFNIEAKDYLFYYRDRDQKEVDLLYVRNDSIYPIEIKKGISPSSPTKNFKILSKYNKNIEIGLVIDSSDKIRPINEKAYEIPVYLI